MDPDQKKKIRRRAFSLWEQDNDPNVPPEEYWRRASDIERNAPMWLEEPLRKFLRPEDKSKFRWLKRAFFTSNTDWIRTLEEVDRRRIAFSLHKEALEDIKFAKHEIAAVDIFVEKAIHFLELKSQQCVLWAILSGVVLAGIIVWDFIYLIEVASIPQFFKNTMGKEGVPKEFGPYLFAMWVLRGAAISALSGAVIYFSGSLVRAFLHEATTYWNRRHSARLGRLFIYLKFAGVNNEAGLAGVRKELTVEDIERAFGWNLETSTAFRDMKPELMNGSPVDPVKTIDAINKLIKTAKQPQSDPT